MPVPLMDLAWQVRTLRPELDAAIARCLDETAFVQGARAAEFERAYADACGVKHAIACGNGTDALYLALKALGVGPGREVILPALTFIATLEAVAMVGATPVLVDVDEHGVLDLAAVARALSPRTAAVIPVLLYGRSVPFERLRALCEPRKVALVADAAQAHGAHYLGRPVATWADITCTSFYPGKNLGAFGDAGACVTNDATWADDIDQRRNHGRRNKYEHDFLGVNMRIDEIQAAVLAVKLPHLARWTARRQHWAERYHEALRGVGDLVLPSLEAHGGSVWHLFVVQTAARDALQRFLQERGIGTGIHYPLPLHLQRAAAGLGHARGAFPQAEAMADRVLSLPLFEGMLPEHFDEVVAQVRAHFAQ